MTTTTPIQPSFTAGELSPLIAGTRVDLARWFIGAKTITNFTIIPQGGLWKRPGTKYVGPVKNNGDITHLIPFEFNEEQVYVLEAGNGYLRFYKNNGAVVVAGVSAWTTATPYAVMDLVEHSGTKYYCVTAHTSGTFATDLSNGYWYALSGDVYEIPTPYNAIESGELRYVQYNDILYIVHKNHPIKKLQRFGHTAWKIVGFNFDSRDFPPFMVGAHLNSHTMQASATTGSVTLTSNIDFFDPLHVGGHIAFISSSSDGYCEITSYTDAKHVTANVIATLPSSATSATNNWREGYFSDYRGYASQVTIFEQRLVLASTNYKPQSVIFSTTGSYESFQTDSTNDSGFSITIGSSVANRIIWLKSGRRLICGTLGGIFVLSSVSSTEPLTQTNISPRLESTFNVADILPIDVNSALFFVQRNKTTLRQFSYSFQSDSFLSLNTTIEAEHITSSGIIDIKYQQTPYNLIYCLLSDGTIALLTREIEQQVLGFSKISTNGVVESICIIPNGEEEQVWITVRRTVGGVDKRYIEYFSKFKWINPQDAFFVDSGLTYDGASTNIITGLSHLEGLGVSVYADGLKQSQKTVNGGQITLDSPASIVSVGLQYDSIFTSLDIEAGSRIGSAQTKKRRFYKMGLRLYKSQGGQFGIKSDELYDLEYSTSEQYTGDLLFNMVGGYRNNLHLYLRHADPSPFILLGIIPRLDTQDA